MTYSNSSLPANRAAAAELVAILRFLPSLPCWCSAPLLPWRGTPLQLHGLRHSAAASTVSLPLPEPLRAQETAVRRSFRPPNRASRSRGSMSGAMPGGVGRSLAVVAREAMAALLCGPSFPLTEGEEGDGAENASSAIRWLQRTTSYAAGKAASAAQHLVAQGVVQLEAALECMHCIYIGPTGLRVNI